MLGVAIELLAPDRTQIYLDRYQVGKMNVHHKWPRSQVPRFIKHPPDNRVRMNMEAHAAWHQLAANSTPVQVLVGLVETMLPPMSIPELSFRAHVPGIGDFHYDRRGDTLQATNVNPWNFLEIAGHQWSGYSDLFRGRDPYDIFHELATFWSPPGIFTSFSGRAKRNGLTVDL